MDRELARILNYIEILEKKWAALEDRVAVLEEVTIGYEIRIEDLEERAEEDDYLKGD